MKYDDKKFTHTDEHENEKFLSEDEMDNAVGGHYGLKKTVNIIEIKFTKRTATAPPF